MTDQPTTATGRSRRAFLATLGSAFVGTAAALAACSDSTGDQAGPTSPAPASDAPTSSASTATTPDTAPATAPATTAPGTAPIAQRRPAASPYLSGNFAPAPETTAFSPVVEGRLPDALTGTLFRHGPNPLVVDVNNPNHSWFAGDGMVHLTTFEEGTCRSYRSRMVRTDAMAASVGESSVGGPAPLLVDMSNTSVVSCFGRILSTTESAVPYELDRTGATLGRFDFGGGLTHGLSAHPKWDPVRQELHHVSYAVAGAPYLVWQVIDGNGRITRTTPIDLPASTMVHTMSLTERHVVIYDSPIEFDPTMLEQGFGFPYRWNSNRPTRLGVIARDGDPTVRWIEIEPCMVFHDQGAHDVLGADGTVRSIEVVVPVYDRMFDSDLGGPLGALSILERWTIDLVTGTLARTPLDDRGHEFPRVNDALGLTEPRFVYTVAGTTGGAASISGVGNQLAKHDLRTGTVETVSCGPGTEAGEALFVVDPARTADEDGGWLLSYVYDATVDTSRIVVIDAQDLTAGPVASVQLPVRVPFGFHATWVTA
jgi:carotenoid cleavage dioxygenase